MSYEYTLTDEADAEAHAQVLAPLIKYNESKAGPDQHRPLAVLLRDGPGQIIGGLWGATRYGWLFIQLLFVPEEARGKGVGRHMMHLAEREAVNRGCHSAWLDTHEFQAQGFYEKLGYKCFGVLPNYPMGFKRAFLQKDLVAARESV